MKIYGEVYLDTVSKLAALGDAIVMSPIVHRLTREAEHLYLPCRISNYSTVGCLYQDYPNITVVPYSDQSQITEFVSSKNLIKINLPDIVITKMHLPGISVPVDVPIYWERQLYEHFDIPFSTRYKEFKMPSAIPGTDQLYDLLTEGNQDYCLFHQQTFHHGPGKINIDLQGWRAACGFPPLKIIEITPGITDNLFQFAMLIEKAKEIHCVCSSFFNLVDSMHDRTNARLFFHDIRADNLMMLNSKWNNYMWSTVSYEPKM